MNSQMPAFNMLKCQERMKMFHRDDSTGRHDLAIRRDDTT